MTFLRNCALTLLAVATTSPSYAQHTGGHNVTATVYHPWYIGRRTACGDVYKDTVISAAHPHYPCGTKLLIRHKGREVPVRVNDRCACAIDLSYAAAKALGVPTDGIGRVFVHRF
jgi:rare lipoprotein A